MRECADFLRRALGLGITEHVLPMRLVVQPATVGADVTSWCDGIPSANMSSTTQESSHNFGV